MSNFKSCSSRFSTVISCTESGPFYLWPQGILDINNKTQELSKCLLGLPLEIWNEMKLVIGKWVITWKNSILNVRFFLLLVTIHPLLMPADWCRYHWCRSHSCRSLLMPKKLFWCQSLLMPVTIDAHEALLMPVTIDAHHYWCQSLLMPVTVDAISHYWCQSLLMPVTIDARHYWCPSFRLE